MSNFTISDGNKPGPLLDALFDLPPELLTAVATVLGFALLGDMNYNQQNSLGNFLMLIAQILETNSAQKQLLVWEAQSKQSDTMAKTMLQMQRQLEELQKRLDAIQPPPL